MNKQMMTAWMGAALAIGMAAPLAPAQSAAKEDPKTQPVVNPVAPTPPKKVRPVRKSVVDLEGMAKDRRPGQVMPGDPAPMGAMRSTEVTVPTAAPSEAAEKPAMVGKPAPAAAETAAPAANAKTIRLPDTAPYNKPVLKPVSDNSARPEVLSGSKPVAASDAAVSEAAPAAVPETATPVAATPSPGTIPTDTAPPTPSQAAVKPTPAAERAEVAGVPLVDGVVMMQTPAAVSMGPASVRVESITGNVAGVQWRTGTGAWTTPEVGQTVEGKVEVRAGLDAQIVLIVDSTTQLNISRLGRAVIERSTEAKGGSSVSVHLQRGAVDIRPAAGAPTSAGGMFARVRTPDQSFGLTGPLRVEYDAFTGTRRRVGNQ